LRSGQSNILPIALPKLTTLQFGIFAVLLGLFAACNSSISIAIASILWDVIVAIMVLVGAIVRFPILTVYVFVLTSWILQLLSVNMKPSQCSNNNLYAHYTTSNWYFKIFSCTFTPLHRTLEAFLYLGFISLLTTMALNVRDMMKTKKNAKSEALAYPALPQSADRVLPESIDRKPRVAEVVEVA